MRALPVTVDDIKLESQKDDNIKKIMEYFYYSDDNNHKKCFMFSSAHISMVFISGNLL